MWARIQALMSERWGAENQNRLAREAGIGVATVSRLKQADTSIGLDVLEKIASALGVEAWQLICPPEIVGPDGAFQSLSPLALDLARSLDRIHDDLLHQKAYAIAAQVISFGAAPAGDHAAPPLAPQPSESPRQHQ